jgi:hypothetical protein
VRGDVQAALLLRVTRKLSETLPRLARLTSPSQQTLILFNVHLTRHLVKMTELNGAGRYDRRSDGVERVTGRPAMSAREFVLLHANEFGGRPS